MGPTPARPGPHTPWVREHLSGFLPLPGRATCHCRERPRVCPSPVLDPRVLPPVSHGQSRCWVTAYFLVTAFPRRTEFRRTLGAFWGQAPPNPGTTDAPHTATTDSVSARQARTLLQGFPVKGTGSESSMSAGFSTIPRNHDAVFCSFQGAGTGHWEEGRDAVFAPRVVGRRGGRWGSGSRAHRSVRQPCSRSPRPCATRTPMPPCQQGALLVSCRGGGDLPQPRRLKTRDSPSPVFRGAQESQTEVPAGPSSPTAPGGHPSCLCLVWPDGGLGPWPSWTYGCLTPTPACPPSTGPSHLDLPPAPTPGWPSFTAVTVTSAKTPLPNKDTLRASTDSDLNASFLGGGGSQFNPQQRPSLGFLSRPRLGLRHAINVSKVHPGVRFAHSPWAVPSTEGAPPTDGG